MPFHSPINARETERASKSFRKKKAFLAGNKPYF
jgi:hypothetical protein